MPPQHPLTRIEQVAQELGELAQEIEPYAGGDACRALAHWRSELLSALRELQAPAGRQVEGGS